MGHNTYKKGDIMNTKKWAAMLGLLCLFALALLVGCSKKENTSEEQATSPAKEAKTASTPIDPATAATVSGTATYGGAVPKPAKIDMSQDAACKGNNTSETIVADNGKLANVFVYVKDGLGDRTFDVPKDAVTLDQKGCQYHPHVLGVMTGQNIEEIMLPVKCNQHPWMKMYMSVVKSPFFAVTGADGKYEIKGLPPGDYTLAFVQEKLGEQDQKVTLAAKDSKTVDIAFKQ